MLSKSKLLFLSIAFLGYFLSSCQSDVRESDRKLIVTTTNILASSIKEIVKADTTIEVVSIMKAGVDPHLYKPTKKDVDLIKQADIVFYNGLHLEGKMTELLSSLSKKKPVFGLGDYIDKKRLIKVANNVYDPHIWFDLEIWSDVITKAYDLMIEEKFTSEHIVKGSFKTYIKDIKVADDNLKDLFGDISKEKRIVVTAHDAFSYFGRHYNIEVKALQGISTVSEFSIKDINNLVNYIIINKVKTIFAETSVSSKPLIAIVDECNSRNYKLKMEKGLYSDALGDSKSDGSTYLKMVNVNAHKILKGIK